MPDRPQQQVGFQNAEGALDNRELDVRLPKLLRRPAGLIAAEQVGPVAAQGVAVIASLHKVQLAVTYADRIVALRAGRIVEDAPAARFDTRALDQIYDRTTP